jgi:hypothetical protein
LDTTAQRRAGLAHNWLVLPVSKWCFRTLALALPLATLAGCGERVVHRYETVAEARRDGVFERGWVPDILPDSATALVELHDLDTSARCAGARFAPLERASVRAAAASVGFVVYKGERPAAPFKGCPFLIGNIMQADEVLRRSGSEFLILTAEGQLYFWTNHRVQ